MNESQLLIAALAGAVTGNPVKWNTQVDKTAFVKLAKDHGVMGLAYSGFSGPLPQIVERTLSAAYHQAIFADAQLSYIQDRLSNKLEQAGLSHIFLKGACLKKEYPIPALRTMCDLDVLVYAKDFDKLDRIARELDGKPGHSDGNHRNYHFPSGAMVEFHPNLLHQASPVGAGVNPGWQYAKQLRPGAVELTEEGLYLSVLCHLADHFVAGGVGVRFVLDIWVLEHLRQGAVDRSFVEGELDRFGLLTFDRNIRALAEHWFSGAPTTPALEELGAYILTSGSHGFTDRAIVNSLSLSGGKAASLWGKAFYPRAELEDRYPWCKGRPLLLPAAWCARAVRAVTKHGDLLFKWGKETAGISRETVEKQTQMLRRFGIGGRK